MSLNNLISFNTDNFIWNFSIPKIPKDDEDDRSSFEDSVNSSCHSVCTTASSGGEEIQSPPRDKARQSANQITSLNKIAESTQDNDKYKKPTQSYIALISKAILQSPERRLLLGDIYNFIADGFPYYKYTEDRAWKNSIRHNLSLNECFIKNGRADNGKGNYWSIHPACIEDFKKGDFRRRQARRRAKGCQPQPQRPQQHPQSQTHMSGFGVGNGLSSHIQPLQYSYPYNMGYVSMSQMPSGYPSNYGSSQCYPPSQYHSPTRTHPTDGPLMTSSPVSTTSYTPGNMSPPTQYSNNFTKTTLPSYASYLKAHSTESTAVPPNISSTQLNQLPNYQLPQLYPTVSHLYPDMSHISGVNDSMFKMGNGFL